MSDFIDSFLNAGAVVEKEISFNGQTGTGYFRRMTGAQKLALVKGRKYSYNPREKSVDVLEIDLEENEKTQHQVVAFCNCNADGTPKFKNAEAASRLDAGLLAVLFKAANEVNENANEGDDTGEGPGEA